MYTFSYKSSYEQNIDLLGNNNTNILNMKNKVTSINIEIEIEMGLLFYSKLLPYVKRLYSVAP